MSAALQERSLVGLGALLAVHPRPDLVVKFSVLHSLLDHVHESLLVDEVGRSEVFGEGLESRRASGNDCSVAVAVVGDLVEALAVDHLQRVVAVSPVPVALRVDLHSPSLEDVDALVAQRLVDEVVGREEAVDQFGRNGSLESAGPLREEEERGFHYAEVVGSDDF